MKTRPRSILMSLALSALLPLGAMAGSTFPIFAPESGLADGWKTASWNGPVVNETPGAAKGKTTIQVSLKSDAQPFAGVILQDSPGSGIGLTEQLRKTGVVEINFIPGKNALGEPAANSQPLQLALSFRTAEGEVVHGAFVAQTTIAADSKGTLASFSVAAALKGVKAPEQLASISMVRMQYVGAPEAGFGIVDCTIKEQ
jgi:hypothetical protein